MIAQQNFQASDKLVASQYPGAIFTSISCEILHSAFCNNFYLYNLSDMINVFKPWGLEKVKGDYFHI